MKVRVPRKDLANNFSLPEAEDNTSGPMKRGGIADLPLLPKVPRAEILRCETLTLLEYMRVWQLPESFCNGNGLSET